MKKIFLIAAILGLMLTVTTYFVSMAVPSFIFGKGITGSGNITTKTIEAPAFEGIDAARAVKVVISDKTTDKIRIEADDNVMDYVIAKVKDGVLTVSIDKTLNSVSNTNVTVTVPANGHIRSLEASSASTIRSEVTLSGDKFSIDASSAAKIEATVEVTSCDISASSAAKIKLSGSAQKCNIDMSSASKLSAEELIVADCVVETSSAAKASITCTKNLSADASSGSSINYSGNCQTQIDKSSGGSVRKN